MNKTAKIIISLLLVICMCLVCGCSGDTEDTSGTDSSTGSTDTASISSETESKTSSTTSRMTDEEMRLQSYIPSSWSSKINTINQKSNGKFVFAVQSDTHFYDIEQREIGNNLKSMGYFNDFDFIANLGDLIRGYSIIDIDSPENMRACMDSLVTRYTEGGKTPVLMTFGNHDNNNMWSNKHTPGDHTTLINELEHYSRVIAPLKAHNGDNMVTDGESTYYYMDFPDDKVRVIMLNTSDGKFSESFSQAITISDRQVEWFKTTALDTDYAVIVMCHVPLIEGFTDSGNTSPPKASEILDAVESFANNGGQFIGYFYGHTHLAETLVDQNGRVHNTILKSNNEGNNAEVFIVDLQNKTVESVGLGNAKDREYRYF